jgi:hypothetical protein
MAILTKGQTFANADSVTSTKLNNLVDAAAFVAGASGTTDNTSLEVNGSGRLQVKDLGITSAKLAASAVTTTKLPDSTLVTDGVTYAKLQRVANMKVIGNVSGSLGVASEVSILDEDNMASDSATSLATQQSIKAYVDSTLVIATAQASTSGTSINFTGLPATVKRFTVMFNNVSTNGTSNLIVQLGDAGGIEATGYTGGVTRIGTTTTPVENNSTGFYFTESVAASGQVIASVIFSRIDTNVWIASGTSMSTTGGNTSTVITGAKTLSDTLTQIRVTTFGGVNTFDAGTVNIMYE